MALFVRIRMNHIIRPITFFFSDLFIVNMLQARSRSGRHQRSARDNGVESCVASHGSHPRVRIKRPFQVQEIRRGLGLTEMQLVIFLSRKYYISKCRTVFCCRYLKNILNIHAFVINHEILCARAIGFSTIFTLVLI